MYDGRLKEDFKLASGTWVSVGPLRTKIIHAFAPYVTDVAIAGLNRNFLSVLIFPNLESCRSLSPELPDAATAAEILRHGSVTRKFTELLESFAEQSTGNSNRVARAILLEEPPSLDAGEITDKASLNQRAILERRAAAVEEMYSPHPPARVLRLKD
jgi:feruloyl-CoA synthase